ncbi:efflux RND transporter permease subunit [Caulobacter segnis]
MARIEEGFDERRRQFREGNGVDQVGIGLTRQSQANDVAISRGGAQGRRRHQHQPAARQPSWSVAVDNSVFTAEAIHEVWITMGMSIGLVVLVNLVFLGSWRSALIPSIVAPICILSTFIILAARFLAEPADPAGPGVGGRPGRRRTPSRWSRTSSAAWTRASRPWSPPSCCGTRQVFFAVVAHDDRADLGVRRR